MNSKKVGDRMIEVKGLELSYKERKVDKCILGPIDLKIRRGEKLVLIGPSGCGKSTLLSILAGIKKPTKGKVLWKENEKMISYIPQSYGLLPWKNVYQNCILPYRIKGIKMTAEALSYVEEVLKVLGIDDLKKRYPMRLSGGQRQRVAIARAFVLRPQLLLMDEPFSALDAYMREEASKCFLDLWEKEHCTSVLVTHSIEEALYMGDRLVVMSKTAGNIQEIIENAFVGKKYEALSIEEQMQYQKLQQSIKVHLKGGV